MVQSAKYRISRVIEQVKTTSVKRTRLAELNATLSRLVASQVLFCSLPVRSVVPRILPMSLETGVERKDPVLSSSWACSRSVCRSSSSSTSSCSSRGSASVSGSGLEPLSTLIQPSQTSNCCAWSLSALSRPCTTRVSCSSCPLSGGSNREKSFFQRQSTQGVPRRQDRPAESREPRRRAEPGQQLLHAHLNLSSIASHFTTKSLLYE